MGAALGGFVTNITATAEATDGTVFAGIMANALGGVANEYPEFKQILQNDTDKQSVFDQFDNHCLADGVINYIGKHFYLAPTKSSNPAGIFLKPNNF